jgi:hypothetical protein
MRLACASLNQEFWDVFGVELLHDSLVFRLWNLELAYVSCPLHHCTWKESLKSTTNTVDGIQMYARP